MCRLAVDTDDEISWKWISLFVVQNDDAIADELFLTLVMELFRDITEYFIRIAFVDAVKKFKRSVPRKKKQALRTKIQALGERDGSSAKKQILAVSELPSDNQIYICTICQSECEWEPT
ncbi:MAG: hypothetical protein ABW185_26105 [Sedimenticola sp.]